MVIIKISIVARTAAFCVISIREYRSDIALIVGFAAGIIIVLIGLDYLTDIFSETSDLIKRMGVDSAIIKHVIKIVSVGLVTEFAYSAIEDSGQKSLGEKVLFVGKVIITGLNLPLIKQIFDLINKML